MDLGLRDRVYVVTGGSRGLGRAALDALVTDGARVVVSGRDPSALAAVAGEHPDQVVTVAVDNADPAAAATLLAAATETWGRIDGALVSVGGPPPGSVADTSDDAWSRAFDTVFLGTVRLAREIGAHLAGHDGGSLALVLSTSVKAPIGGLAVSNGLRPGLAMVAKTLADELGPSGVRVNSLLPGRIDTDRVREIDATSPDPQAAREAATAGIPLRRYGRPEEFGRVAAFVLSPAASFVSGTALPVDGGLLRAL